MRNRLEENTELFKRWVKEFQAGVKTKKIFDNDDDNNSFFSFMRDFKDWLYDSIHSFLSPNKYDFKYEKAIRIYCDFIAQYILPVCNQKIAKYKGDKEKYKELSKWVLLEDDFYALASYRNLKLFALYLERENNNKVWYATMHLFENLFFYMQKTIFDYYNPKITDDDKIECLRASYFPGAGKTYAANIFSAFWFGVDEEISILRITYSDDLCSIFINQTATIINSKNYRKVFPKFDLGEGIANSKLYTKYSISVGFQFTFSPNVNLFAKTRDGSITGKRGKILIIDDITKGVKEAYDEKLYKMLVNKYDAEWTSRADSTYQPVIALGTMWSPQDLLNVIRLRAVKDSERLENDKNFKYTELVKNKKGVINSVFISTPILDYDTDETTCPLRYSTAKLKKRRENMDGLLWNAVYQQRPQEPSDFIFSEEKIITYDDTTYPRLEFANKPTQCWAFIDPTRKGTDFFAMGIFKRYKMDQDNWSKWYFIDCILEQAPTKELMYDIAYKIISHNVTKLGYENNIDVSFDDLLKTKLKELKHGGTCGIDSFFSNRESKETKIMNASFGIKKEIIFPSKKMYTLNSAIGKAMQQLTMWNLNLRRTDHDDFPDMVSMFVKYYCEETQSNTMQVLDYKIFNFR